jgi:hypothetical protein
VSIPEKKRAAGAGAAGRQAGGGRPAQARILSQVIWNDCTDCTLIDVEDRLDWSELADEVSERESKDWLLLRGSDAAPAGSAAAAAAATKSRFLSLSRSTPPRCLSSCFGRDACCCDIAVCSDGWASTAARLPPHALVLAAGVSTGGGGGGGLRTPSIAAPLHHPHTRKPKTRNQSRASTSTKMKS